MSESDKIRLDPATLRWVAGELGKPWGDAPVDEQERGAQRALGIVSESLTERAAEEDARPPMLSDWVRACECAGMGAVRIAIEREPDGHPHTIRWTVVSFSETDAAFAISHDGIASYSHDGEAWAEVATPAELTAALDRLAEEAPRG